jgi:hypothetical protein
MTKRTKIAPVLSERRKDPHAIELGRRGGLVGGLERADWLSPQRRSQIASAAARARWHGRPSPISAETMKAAAWSVIRRWGVDRLSDTACDEIAGEIDTFAGRVAAILKERT